MTKAERLEWLREWLKMRDERKLESELGKTMKQMPNEFEQDDGSYMPQMQKDIGNNKGKAATAILSAGVSPTERKSETNGERTLKPLERFQEKATPETVTPDSEQSLPVVLDETPPTGLTLLSENWNQELLASAKLIDKSASALCSHMEKLLDGKDLRPVEERTTQAVMCAREIALLIRTKVEIVRAAK